MHRRTIFVIAGTAAFLLLTAPLGAQQLPRSTGWGARMMMVPIMTAYGGYTALCNPRAAARAQWGVEQIQKLVNPRESQRAALNDLKAAAAKAMDLTAGACPREIPRTSSERLPFTERRLVAIAEAVRTVGPPFAAFYASLSEEQKARLDAGPRWRRWRR